MNIPSRYDASSVESKWYAYWMKWGYFRSKVDHREPYTIVIPPPNVTGVLHIGHLLNNTIQDVLIRKARLSGKNACWVPGTDHASIATEAKVVAKLKEKGIDKKDLSREEFLKHAWEWKCEYGDIILDQLKKLGASCDWDRTSFTMDPEMSESVIKVFVDLYNKGLIYRGFRMVNWDPDARTTLSDEEVIYEERQGYLYHINYAVEGTEEFLTIATTRPETIFGDTAICIHPSDARFRHLKGQRAVVPLCNRVIPIIEDDHVDIEFGTGCLKVTPAHDENDKILGDKHQLEIIDIFNEDATLNSFGLHYEGKDRFVAREEVVTELKEKGFLVKTEVHVNKVGTSERTKAVIEPRLSDQWFLKMEDLAKPAMEAVLSENKTIALYPKKFENTYRYWMENIRDWNISRQLWWGQQIPAYFYGDGKDDFVVEQSIEAALALAQKKLNDPSLTTKDLRQDPDTLDTWFSSWLWPISVFDGIRNPENEEINYYYPTSDLVTGPDILFFWVARMIIAGYECKNVQPFHNVYLTGLVRDKQRRKMSKSLGNSPDALKLIENYGADGVRVGLLLSAAAGNDLMFDESLCHQGKQFANKIWNSFRLIKGWKVNESLEQPITASLGLNWYNAKFQKTLSEIQDLFSKYRLSDALMALYRLIIDDFSSWLLEIIKPSYQQPIDKKTATSVAQILEDNLKLLHPFMPFITEEIWQHITPRTPEEALVIATYPTQEEFDSGLIASFDYAAEVVSGIRTIRKEKKIPFKDSVQLFFMSHTKESDKFDPIIQKLTNTSQIKKITKKVEGASFRVQSNVYFVPVAPENIDLEIEILNLQTELKRVQGFLLGIQKKLANERFMKNAPQKVIDLERKKETDTIAKVRAISSRIKSLKE